MTLDLRIAERDWSALQKQFQSSFRGYMAPETGALAVLGERRGGDHQEFLVTEVLLPGPKDLKVAHNGALVFDSSFIRRAHLRMRRAGLAGIACFHTHPGCDEHVKFSDYDDEQEPRLFASLKELEPRTHLVSVVAGKRSQFGRVCVGDRKAMPMSRLAVVGEHIQYLTLDGRAAAAPPRPSAVFDSSLAITGAGAMGMLSQMRVAVVGASGTGSLFCELLARAGCRQILLIDPDIVKTRNLNRILHTRSKDADERTAKVEVLRREIEGLGLGCSIEPVCDTILDASVLRRVADCDLIVGCVDRAMPRNFLGKLSAQYLLPYVDVGSEIGGDNRGIVSVVSRVSFVSPGRRCLTCLGIVNARRLHFESISAAERQRQISLGYSDDLAMDQPAVMDLNMRAASGGMLLLRHILQPFMREPLPLSISENTVTWRTILATKPRVDDGQCPICQQNPHFGYGDCGPAISFDRDTVRSIVGAEFDIEAGPSSAKTSADAWWRRAARWIRSRMNFR